MPVLSFCAKMQWDILEVPGGLLAGMSSGLGMGTWESHSPLLAVLW